MTENELALLERYLAGELNEEEAKEMEARLANDQDFRQAAEDLKLLELALQRKEEATLRRKMEEWDNAAAVKSHIPQKGPGSRLWWLAAAILILAIATPFILDRQISSSELHKAYYSIPSTEKVSARGTHPQLDSALIYFEKGEYHNALSIFQSHPDHPYGLYHAISLFETGNAQQSRELLDALPHTGINLWYRAMLALYLENEAEARDILEDLRSSDDYGHKAEEILRKL